MLPKKSRLTRQTFPRGKSARATFSWGSIAASPADSFRGAVVLSKKTLPKAHDRNRARRRLYGALESATKNKALTVSIVIYPNRTALVASPSEMVSDISRFLVH